MPSAAEVSAPTLPRPQPAGVPTAGAVAFSHEALLYQGDAGFLAGTVPFVQEGLAADEPVLVVVNRDKIAGLKKALGRDAPRVQFADMAAVGLNPARIIPAWQDFASEHITVGRSFRGIGEPISAQRSPDELIECQRHESLLNVAFAGTSSWRLLCPYDVTALTPPVIDEALRSHPFIVDDGNLSASSEYRGLGASGAPFAAPLTDPPPSAEAFDFDSSSLKEVRRFVRRRAGRLGFGDTASRDLALAAHEIATNSLRYGGGRGTLRAWTHDHSMICEISDSGHITAPLAGRERPPVDKTHGRGLWLAHHLCDLVQMRTLPSGNVVRLHQRLH